ncbi:hypothetical protein INT48_009770 [Thamnidium elegans]|uniref:Uncharacterized protein n=1 Tax=Thamnidium elegans TaxID=101142 RepID=A0A8H7SRJ9_9FUNG|nr:hypothetical protein INT48_009770 [Thamnidium elegans]
MAEQLLEKTETEDNELDVCKLCLSPTISFVSPKVNAIFEKLLPAQLYNQARVVSKERKINLDCSDEIKININRITNGLSPFENDMDITRCIVYLDKLKNEETDKESINYQILRISDKIITATETLRKLKNPHEAF